VPAAQRSSDLPCSSCREIGENLCHLATLELLLQYYLTLLICDIGSASIKVFDTFQ